MRADARNKVGARTPACTKYADVTQRRHRSLSQSITFSEAKGDDSYTGLPDFEGDATYTVLEVEPNCSEHTRDARYYSDSMM